MHMLRLVVSGLGLVACTTARNIFSLQPNRQGTHLLPLTHGDAPDHKLVERGSSPRCGPDHGKCPEGKCCSTAGISTYFLVDELARTDGYRLLRGHQEPLQLS